jgi:hypothetical protein
MNEHRRLAARSEQVHRLEDKGVLLRSRGKALVQITVLNASRNKIRKKQSKNL